MTDAGGIVGSEWVIEARGCRADALADIVAVRAVCERAVRELALSVVGAPQWHQFGGAAGVTGLYLLTESHLACHTYPEHGLATFNLYCCRPRAAWPWGERLGEMLDARDVTVRVLERGGAR
jgi:S-adenosylmethionine decarboxylase